MPYDIGAPQAPTPDPDLMRWIMPKAVLRPEPAAIPEGEWEGRFKGATGPARKVDFGVRAMLSFTRGEVNGTGRSPEFPYNEPDCRSFTVTGSFSGGATSIEICFDSDFFRDKPFRLEGVIDAGRRAITGEWSYNCGPQCTCGDSTGSFELVRVET